MQNYILFDEYITLGQLIKELGLVSTGGQVKIFLAEQEGQIFYNGEPENRRGKKLYAGDLLEIPSFDLSITFTKASQKELDEHQNEKNEEARVKALVKKMNANQTKKNTKKNAPRFPGRH